MRNRLVVPGRPKGTPVLRRCHWAWRSPLSGRPCMRVQSWTSRRSPLSTTTECTHQTKVRRSAVAAKGVMLRMGASGLSRAARMLALFLLALLTIMKNTGPLSRLDFLKCRPNQSLGSATRCRPIQLSEPMGGKSRNATQTNSHLTPRLHPV